MSPADFSWYVTLLALWLGFVGFMVFLVFLVGLWEQRMVWPYASVDRRDPSRPVAEFDPEDPYAASAALAARPTIELSEYALRSGAAAANLGFGYLGGFQDVRGGLYQVHYSFGMATGRDILALIGAGTMAKIPLQATWLYTRLADGTWLATLDNEKGGHVDLTKQTDEALYAGTDFATLLRWHRDRIAASGQAVVPFPEADPLVDFRAFRAGRVDRLEQMGLIRFLDADRNRHRFTIRGSALYSVRMHARGYRRRFWPDRWARLRRRAAAGATG